jgi:hypothetical protein
MPFPSDEETPPVTKTYLALGINLVHFKWQKYKE